jgi:ABC-type uncharacterized transport system ATPase subunit
VVNTNRDELAAWMMGSATTDATKEASWRAAAPMAAAAPRHPTGAAAQVRLALRSLCVEDDRGHTAVNCVSLAVRAGEILGLAGISGNGQKELVEALVGQRRVKAGDMQVAGKAYHATRAEMAQQRLFAIPEEPLKNACVAAMSVAQNLALRNFDQSPFRRGGWWLGRRAMRQRAAQLIDEFKVHPPLPEREIGTLSGGNVQRTVLARELGQAVNVLIVANPVFGLDFASVADIHARLMAVRNTGAAVLLVSEDIDELLELADRIVVMAQGELVFETPASCADRTVLGQHMAGHGDTAVPQPSSPDAVRQVRA